jgi:alkylhydroperoxidase/carboxymuconolactone decarboxylase family protein YurZ
MAVNLPPFMKSVAENDPDFAKTIEEIVKKAMGEGALDRKTKTLIALALDASHGAKEGVASLAKTARQLGVSEEEINETLRMAYFVAGNSILAMWECACEEK